MPILLLFNVLLIIRCDLFYFIKFVFSDHLKRIMVVVWQNVRKIWSLSLTHPRLRCRLWRIKVASEWAVADTMSWMSNSNWFIGVFWPLLVIRKMERGLVRDQLEFCYGIEIRNFVLNFCKRDDRLKTAIIYDPDGSLNSRFGQFYYSCSSSRFYQFIFRVEERSF